MAIHLQPLSGAQVIPFPSTRSETTEVVAAQLEGIQAALIARHGEKDGRMLFAEAGVGVIARKAKEHDSLVATLWAVVWEYERAGGIPPMGDEPFPGGRAIA